MDETVRGTLIVAGGTLILLALIMGIVSLSSDPLPTCVQRAHDKCGNRGGETCLYYWIDRYCEGDNG